jgi:hypothetical protein
MKVSEQIKNCNNIVKVLIKIYFIPQVSNNNITKSVSYHKNFNVEKYIEDEKKYVKKMVKYYNQN